MSDAGKRPPRLLSEHGGRLKLSVVTVSRMALNRKLLALSKTGVLIQEDKFAFFAQTKATAEGIYG